MGTSRKGLNLLDSGIGNIRVVRRIFRKLFHVSVSGDFRTQTIPVHFLLGDIMETELSKEFTDPVSTNDNGYLDTAMQPDYVDSWGGGNKKIHGMIVRLVPNRKGAVPTELNAGVIQMRMVLVAGVISASLRIEKNESAEDDEDVTNSNMARIFLSVKVAPGEDSFVSDLNKAIIDGSDGSFKLGNVDFWENHNANNRSGKDTPEEKSTEFAESENDNADDGMYLDDDEKLASRVTGGKKGGKASKRRPWSMFNPSSALGLNSVFNSADLLEMVEYDSDEAEARKQEAAAGSAKAAPAGSADDEEAAATAPPPPVSRFGIFRRLFG